MTKHLAIRSKELGFTVIELVIAVSGVVGLGVGGYVLYLIVRALHKYITG